MNAALSNSSSDNSISGDGNECLRVVVVDDHEFIRAGLSAIIRMQPGVELVGEARDGEEGLEVIAATCPDVVIMDINMPRMDGLETTRRLAESHPQLPVVGLSMHSEKDMAERMLQAGARAYLCKDAPRQELFRTLFEVVRSVSADGEA